MPSYSPTSIPDVEEAMVGPSLHHVHSRRSLAISAIGVDGFASARDAGTMGGGSNRVARVVATDGPDGEAAAPKLAQTSRPLTDGPVS